MGILDRFRGGSHGGKAGETPLVLSREATQAFIDLLGAMRAEMEWRVSSPHARNLKRLKATVAQHESVLRQAGKAIRHCQQRAEAEHAKSMLRYFEQPVVLEQGADAAEEGVFLLWDELHVLSWLSSGITDRGAWRKNDSGWQAHFSLAGGANGPIYIDSALERLKVLAGQPTLCRECGAPVLPRRELSDHDLVRLGTATHHLERGLCRGCMTKL